MTNKASIWYGMSRMKCPRCHHGDLFVHKNPYNIRNFDNMPLHCPVCGQSNFPEIGFYYGAMYASYMLSVAVSVFDVLAFWILFGFHIVPIIITNTVILIILFPYLYRYSRVIWIYVTVSFNYMEYEKAQQK